MDKRTKRKKKSISPSNDKVIATTDATYEDFFKGVRLANLGMMNCSAHLDRSAYADIEEPVQRLAAHYKLAYLGEEFFDAIAEFKLTIDGEKQLKDTAPLIIECVFEAHFHVESAASRVFAERFVDGELRLVLWPYFRQFVTDTTARMTINPIVIPFSTKSS